MVDQIRGLCMATDTGVPRSQRSAREELEGSDAGFANFYELEFPRQIRRAGLLLGSQQAAHDAVQDAFVEVFGRWSSLDRPGPYLETTVLNRCRDIARHREVVRRRTPAPVADVPAQDAPLHDALAALPFNHRAAVVMRYYLQMSEAEIAAQLGCRSGSVGPWIQRGLRRLRKELS